MHQNELPILHFSFCADSDGCTMLMFTTATNTDVIIRADALVWVISIKPSDIATFVAYASMTLVTLTSTHSCVSSDLFTPPDIKQVDNTVPVL